MKIGILAVQGAFVEHEKMLDKLGVESFEIRQKADLDTQFDGIILPGGESTVMGKLIVELDMYEKFVRLIKNGMPVFGTCAGMILLAKNISNDDRHHLALMDIVVKRNGYGRQLGSFKTIENFNGIGKIPMTFIRAPYIEKVEENVDTLAVVDGKIVAARQGNMLACAFHPELCDDTRVHEYFINIIKNR